MPVLAPASKAQSVRDQGRTSVASVMMKNVAMMGTCTKLPSGRCLHRKRVQGGLRTQWGFGRGCESAAPTAVQSG